MVAVAGPVLMVEVSATVVLGGTSEGSRPLVTSFPVRMRGRDRGGEVSYEARASHQSGDAKAWVIPRSNEQEGHQKRGNEQAKSRAMALVERLFIRACLRR